MLIRSRLLTLLLCLAGTGVRAGIPTELECDVAALFAATEPTRRSAMGQRLLGYGPQGLAALEALAQHPRAGIRVAAASSLGNDASDDAIRTLGSLLYDPDPEVALAAARSLLRPANRGCAPTLRAALRSWVAGHDEMRAALIDGLAQHGDAADRELIRPGLAHPDSLVVVAALHYFGRYGTTDDAAQVGAHLLSTDSAASRVAFAALDRLYGRPSPERLLPLLTSPIPAIADYALIALRRFALDDAFVRDAALARLATFRDPLRLLEQASDPLLRIDALRTLHRYLENDFGFFDDASELKPLAARLPLELDARVRKVLLQILAGVSSRRVVLKPPNVGEDLPAASNALVHLAIDDVVLPALIAALADVDVENRTFADEVLRQLSGRDSTFPFDGVGTAEERAVAVTAWRAWWAKLTVKDPAERTRDAVGGVIAKLLLDPSSLPSVLPGLVYVTGVEPTGAGAAAIVDQYGAWWQEHGSETPGQWYAPVALRPFEDVSLRAWHRMSRLLGRSIELPLMVLPEERRRVATALSKGEELRPAARASSPWLAEVATSSSVRSPASGFALLAFASQEYAVASSAFRNLLRGAESDTNRVYLGASAWFSSPPDRDEAEMQLTRVLAPRPDRGLAEAQVAAYYLGRMRLAEGRPREAAELLLQTLNMRSVEGIGVREVDAAVAELELAIALFESDRGERAQAALAGAKAATRDEAACVLASRVGTQRSADGESLAACDRALAARPLAPILREARAQLHDARVERGDDAAGTAAPADARAAARGDWEALACIAGARDAVARGLTKADASRYAAWMDAVFGDSASPEALALRGRLALAAELPRAAIADLACAVAGGDDSPATLLALGLASELKRDDVGALRAYVRLSRTHPPVAKAVQPYRARVTRRLLLALGLRAPGD